MSEVTCPTVEELEQLASGMAAANGVAAHLAACVECQARMARIEADNLMIAQLRGARPERADAAPGPEALPDEVIDGYEPLSVIDQGGQGVVYRAIQSATRRMVALKVLMPGAISSTRQRRLFEREVELVANLRHPNIVTLYDCGFTPRGRPYYAMELVDGVPLDLYVRGLADTPTSEMARGARDTAGAVTVAAAVVESHVATDPPPPPRSSSVAAALPESRGARRTRAKGTLSRVLHLFARICSAVSHAHQRGIVHRDLKPSNILIDDAGEPHVLDFGLAKVMRQDALAPVSGMTLVGEFKGTFAYASPEQTSGDPELVDIRTDVYSLGVILYELLTGQSPYPPCASVAELLRAIAELAPPKPTALRRDITNDLETIILTALTKERERRYPSAGALLDDLTRYLNGDAIDARRSSTWYMLRKAAVRHRYAVAAGVAAVLFLAVFAITLAVQKQRMSVALGRAVNAEKEARASADQIDAALRESNVERGIAAAAAGNTALAEDLLWREQLRTTDEADSGTVNEHAATLARRAHWALWSMYAHTPCLAAWQAHPGTTRGIGFIDNGRSLMSCGDETQLRVWDVATRNPTRGINLGAADWEQLTISPDQQLFATTNRRGAIACWDLATGMQLWRARREQGDGLHVLRFTPDSARLIDAYTTLTYFDARRGRQLTSQELGGAARELIFSHDGNTMAISQMDLRVSLWDARQARRLADWTPHRDQTHCLAFSPDDSLVLTAGTDAEMCAWDVRTHVQVRRWHDGHGTIRTVHWSTDGAAILAAGQNKSLKTWDAHGDQVLYSWGGHRAAINAIAVPPNGEPIATCAFDGAIRLWEPSPMRCLRWLSGHEGTVFAVAFSPVGDTLASCAADGAITLWSTTSTELIRTWKAHSGVAAGIAWSADGRLLASGGYDGRVRVWDPGTGAQLMEAPQEGMAVSNLAFSPDGRHLAAACGSDELVRVWSIDVASTDAPGRLVERAVLRVSAMRLPCMAWSPNSMQCVAGGYDGSIITWNLSDGSRVLSIAGHAGPVRSVSYTPDGRSIISASDDWTVRVWNAETGKLAKELDGHQHQVFAAAVSTDGSMIASGTRGGDIRLWDTASGHDLLAMQQHTQAIFSIAFSRDGRYLATAGEDKRIGLWDLRYYDRHISGSAEYQRRRLLGGAGH